jgi:O-antigen ligase
VEKSKSSKFLSVGFSILSFLPVFYFYLKYVPLVKGFQTVLLPILALVVVTTALKLRSGIVLFVFLFPLVNGLPYFFGIGEHTPHAPVALVLFLSFLWGWLINTSIHGPQPREKNPLRRPLLFFAVAVLVSAAAAFLKFSNFFPFLSDSIYELQTNVSGVGAGGALMSVLFSSLNYLTGFVFFLIIFPALKNGRTASKILLALLSSTSLAVLFGLFQNFFDPSFGNTDFWVKMEQVNATFKDPNSFGLFLAALLPLALATGLSTKGLRRILTFGLAGLILVIFPQVGMRSGFLAMVVSLFIFAALVISTSRAKLAEQLKRKRVWVWAGLCVIVLTAAGIWGLRHTRLLDKIRNYSQPVLSMKGLIHLSPERYFLWKEAIEMMKDYPISGVGIGSYIIDLPNYYTLNPQKDEAVLAGYKRNDSAENYFVHVGAEMGLIGILFAGWLFLAIAVRMIRAVRNKRGMPSRIYTFGIFAGMIAYFINLFFHSFIGSFEVKYLFWLGVAALFQTGGSEGEKEKKIRSGKTVLYCGLGLLTVFAGTSLWQSSHSLSLRSRTEQFGIEQMFGLYGAEKTEEGRIFQWSGKNAGLTLTIKKPTLEIPLLASHPDISERPLKVRIYLLKNFFKEKRLIEEFTINENKWQTHRYDLSEEVGSEVFLLVKVSRTWSPQKEMGIPDARRLGIALGRIEFR